MGKRLLGVANIPLEGICQRILDQIASVQNALGKSLSPMKTASSRSVSPD